MKRSGSSVLAERRKQRAAVTPTPVEVRYVKFSPEEMAYEVPRDTSGWTYVGRGPKALFAKPTSQQNTVELDADVARVFKDAASVNKALRKLIEAMPEPAVVSKRPTRRKAS